MNRKEFLRSLGRASILGGMGVLIAVFYKQDKITSYSDCSDNLFCRSCNNLKKCTLPEALSERRKDDKG